MRQLKPNSNITAPITLLERLLLPGTWQRREKICLRADVRWIWRAWPLRWSVTGWRMALIPNRSTCWRRSSSPNCRTTSSTASRCIIAALRMDNLFSTRSAGTRRMMAERLASPTKSRHRGHQHRRLGLAVSGEVILRVHRTLQRAEHRFKFGRAACSAVTAFAIFHSAFLSVSIRVHLWFN